MKYLDEYRDQQVAQNIVAEIRRTGDASVDPLMEVCGGADTLDRQIRARLSACRPEIELVHGPGCQGLRHAARHDSIVPTPSRGGRE